MTEGIPHQVFYGDLVYKLRRVRCEANFVSSGSKIVKRLRRRTYDPLIIDRTIGLVLGPSTALYRYFLKRLKSSLRKFYGRYGDLIKHYAVSLSQILHDILGHDHIQWHPQLIRYYTSLRPYYRTWLYYRFWPNFGGFHRTLQRVRLANRGRLLLRTPGPVPFGTCICSNVETILSWTCHVYGRFELQTSLGTSILPS